MSSRPPVLVLPGFGAGDRSTVGLRTPLSARGHPSHGWKLGRNAGMSPEFMAALVRRLHELVERHDQPVALLGWSLGGIYAWELARRFPTEVQQVVTLGTPLLSMVDTAKPAAVPLASIWSRHDRIVSWKRSKIDELSRRENIEVRSTHATLGFDPLVAAAVVDRMAQSPESWKPFRRPPLLRAVYP